MAIVARFGYKIKRRKRSHDLRMVVKGNICLRSYKGELFDHARVYIDLHASALSSSVVLFTQLQPKSK